MKANSPEYEASVPTVTVDEVMRAEMEELGSVAAYVRSLAKEYEEDKNYHTNLFQLQRVANLIVSPQEGMAKDSTIAGFYWGEILGLTVGERIFTDEWADTLYKTINRHFLEAWNGSLRELPHSILKTDERLHLPESVRQKVETADMLLALLEDEQYDLPQSYQDMINEWAPRLSENELDQFYITAGFNFLVNITLSQAEYELDVLREVQVGRAVDAAVNWKKIERRGKSTSFGLLPPES